MSNVKNTYSLTTKMKLFLKLYIFEVEEHLPQIYPISFFIYLVLFNLSDPLDWYVNINYTMQYLTMLE